MPTEKTALTIYGKGGSYFNMYITEIISDTEFKFSRQPSNANGKLASTSDYSAGMKRYIKRLSELKEEADKIKHAEKIKELMPKFELESWTNSEDKVVKATFVSLIDGNITIAISKRKNPVTFPVTKLSEVSQERAKDLAAKLAEAEAKIKELK